MNIMSSSTNGEVTQDFSEVHRFLQRPFEELYQKVMRKTEIHLDNSVAL